MEKKKSVSLEIAQILAMRIGFEPLLKCLPQCCGFGCLPCDTDIIKVDGVIEFVLQGDNNHCILRHFFLDSDVDTQEESDHKA